MGNSVRDQRGIGLMETVITLSILSVMSLVMSSLFSHMTTENRAVEQKQEMLELKNQLIKALGSNSVCTWQFRDMVFDANGATQSQPSNDVLTIPALYSGPAATSPLIVRADPNNVMPGSTTLLKVSNISLSRFFPTGRPNEYTGTLQVNFVGDSVVRQMHPVKVQQIFTIAAGSTPSALKIESCGPNPNASNPNPGECTARTTSGQTFQVPTGSVMNKISNSTYSAPTSNRPVPSANAYLPWTSAASLAGLSSGLAAVAASGGGPNAGEQLLCSWGRWVGLADPTPPAAATTANNGMFNNGSNQSSGTANGGGFGGIR